MSSLYDGQWINDDIIIDFPVTAGIQELMNMCEQAYRDKDYAYFNYEEALDYACKELVTKGKMTHKEWETILQRYEHCGL